jgi:hypothetical protein
MRVFGSVQVQHGGTVLTWTGGDVAFFKEASNSQQTKSRITLCVFVCQMVEHIAQQRLAHVAYWYGAKARWRLRTVPICDLGQIKSGRRKTSAVTLGAHSRRTFMPRALATFQLQTFQSYDTLQHQALVREHLFLLQTLHTHEISKREVLGRKHLYDLRATNYMKSYIKFKTSSRRCLAGRCCRQSRKVDRNLPVQHSRSWRLDSYGQRL